MPDNPGLLRTIIDAPDDDAPRLVYADWLDDHGDHVRAAFIRAHVAIEAFVTEPTAPFVAGFSAGQLRREHAAAVLAPFLARGLLPDPPHRFNDELGEWVDDGRQPPVNMRLRRGFVEAIDADALAFLGRCLWDGGSVFDLTPLRHLRLRPRWQSHSPDEGWLRLALPDLRTLLALPGVARLETLDLCLHHFGDEGARAILAAAHLTPATRLLLSGNHFGADAQRALEGRFGASVALEPNDDDNDEIPF